MGIFSFLALHELQEEVVVRSYRSSSDDAGQPAEGCMLPDDLPQDFLEFNARFGTDEQCRKYLIKARWPDGFRCDGCGHGHAYTLRTRLVYECVACRKQHSLLAGTIFEQTKTALARWFLAIYLVTSSKGGIAAAELQRQLGLGSYQTAWSWLHKLRKAMVRPDREPLAGRVEADETYVGGPRPGKRGRGAAGKALAGGARGARRRQGAGRRGGGGRPRRGPRRPARPAPARPAGRRLGREPGRLPRRPRRQAGDRDHRRLARLPRPAGRGLRTRAGQLERLPGRRRAPAARHPPRLRPRQALAPRHPPRRGGREAPPRLPRRVRLPVQPPHRQPRQPRLRPADRAGRQDQARHLPRDHRHPSLSVPDRQFGCCLTKSLNNLSTRHNLLPPTADDVSVRPDRKGRQAYAWQRQLLLECDEL